MLILYFISFLLINLRLASKVSNRTFEELFIIFYSIYSASIVLTGIILTNLNLEHRKGYWVLCSLVMVGTIHSILNLKLFKIPPRTISAFKLVGRNIQKFHESYQKVSILEKVLGLTLFAGFILIFIIQALQFFQIIKIPLWPEYAFKKSNFLNEFPFLLLIKSPIWLKFHNFLSFLISGIAFYSILKQLKISKKIRLILSFLVFFIPYLIFQGISQETEIIFLDLILISLYYFFGIVKKFNFRDILLILLTLIVVIYLI